MRQRHARQHFEAVREVHELGDSSNYGRASVLVKYRVGPFEETRKCLAVFAVAYGAFRHAWTDDIAFDRAASALKGMFHFPEVRRHRWLTVWSNHSRRRATYSSDIGPPESGGPVSMKWSVCGMRAIVTAERVPPARRTLAMLSSTGTHASFSPKKKMIGTRTREITFSGS